VDSSVRWRTSDWVGLGAEKRGGSDRRIINQSSGCCQGTILVPVAAWHFLPGSMSVSWNEDATLWSREASWPATRPTAIQRVSTRASLATRVAKCGHNFGCKSERCVGKRPQCGEKDMARAVGPASGRVTTCHGDNGRHGAGHVQRRVTTPGHGGHGAGHGIHGGHQIHI
jgi:hypothetical protein